MDAADEARDTGANTGTSADTAFGVLLRRQRRAAGLTQEALAERAGVSVRGLQHLEAGEAHPARASLHLLAAALRLTPEDRAAFEAAARPAPTTPRRPRTTIQVPSNLPAPLSSFVGREREVAAVWSRLLHPDVRLVTLTGTGGVGKTRLALQVAAGTRDAFADGALFVPLAPLADARLVAAAIAEAAGVREEGGRGLAERLREHFRARRALLVLDNFEHLLTAAPEVAHLLAAAPAVKALVTSRAPLRLSGEHIVDVPPLSLPDGAPGEGHAANEERLRGAEAVRLFCERASAAGADVPRGGAALHTIGEICRRLDGLPLAIELAAARATMLDPAALLARLDRRLPLLTGGSRDLPARQQTVQATIEWSYALLAPEVQARFREIGVFAGGFTLEAAAHVCRNAPLGASEAGEDALLDQITSLVEQHLLEHRPETVEPGASRFRLLETVREFALAQLTSRGEAAAARRRHAAYFTSLADRAEPELTGSEQAVWLARLERDHENLRAALRYWQEEGDEAQYVRLAGALWRFWEVRGHWSEGRRWLAGTPSPPGRDAALAAHPDAAERARALLGAGALAFYQADYGAAGALLADSVALSRLAGDTRGLGWALIYSGWLANDGGDLAGAAALVEEGLRHCRSAGDRQGKARALSLLGLGALFRGEFAAARPLHEQSLALNRSLGNTWGTAWALTHLGVTCNELGERGRARGLFEESLTLWRTLNDRRNLAYSLGGLGFVAVDEDDPGAARACCAEALPLLAALGDRWGLRLLFGILAGAAARTWPERALELAGTAAALDASVGPPPPLLQGMTDRWLASARASVDAPTQAVAWARGQARSFDAALALAREETGSAAPPGADRQGSGS